VRFPAVQTYGDGQIQNWIGPDGAEEPAPSVEVTAGQAGGDRAMPVALAALIAGLLGLVLGSVAYVRTRRPTPASKTAAQETTSTSA
jgi:hypothetical protein